MPPISATWLSLTLCISLPVNPAFFALEIQVEVDIAETRKTMKKSSTKWRKKKTSMVSIFLREAFIYFLDVESLDCSSLVGKGYLDRFTLFLITHPAHHHLLIISTSSNGEPTRSVASEDPAG